MAKKGSLMARARLAMAGTDHYYQEFGLVRSKNALQVIMTLIQQFRNSFLTAVLGGHVPPVVMSKRAGEFYYLVALALLAHLDGDVDKRQFWRDLKQVRAELPRYGTDDPLPDDALVRTFEVEEST